MYVIDLFCGAGGFSYGASQSGANIAIVIDTWEDALQVHKDNHSKTIHLNMQLGGNIKKMTEYILSYLPKLKK